MLRKLVLALAFAGAVTLPPADVAEAAVGDGIVAAPVATRLLPVEEAQFFFGGRNFCFYPDGWRGPGFYWCGYAWNNGYGWGGPVGWHGWHGGGGWRGGGRRFGGRPGGFGGGHMHMGGGPRHMGGGHMHVGGGPRHRGGGMHMGGGMHRGGGGHGGARRH